VHNLEPNQNPARVDIETDPQPFEDTVEARESSARRALEGYRERRRQRRGHDTYFGSVDLLGSTAHDGLNPSELESRRSVIMEEAVRDGMSAQLAEFLYDIALEEGLDPAIAYELVRSGLGVAPPPEGVSNVAEEPAVDKYLPTWMFPATPPDELLRERMLRVSFRRLRSFLESETDPYEAFRKFANEPDVGHYGY
jgi:hypothetical protein